MIAFAFSIPISYFFDNSNYKTDISKTALILEISAKLNILPKSTLSKIKNIIDLIEH